MKLNHINLVVANVSEAVNLFETYFKFKCTSIKGDNFIAVLVGEGNFTLVIMAAGKEANTNYPNAFHIGFMLDSTDKVNETYLKLQSGGIAIGRKPEKIRDSFGFYFNFDNIMIEVGHYFV